MQNVPPHKLQRNQVTSLLIAFLVIKTLLRSFHGGYSLNYVSLKLPLTTQFAPFMLSHSFKAHSSAFYEIFLHYVS